MLLVVFRVWLVGPQYVIVVFSGLLGLRIALSIAAYPMLYLTYREQKERWTKNRFKSWTALTNISYIVC